MSTTAAMRNGFPTTARPAVEVYLAKGLAPVEMPPRSKDPGRPGWPQERLTLDTIDQHFPADQARNVGVLNGAPSDNTADADLDCAEAVAVAPLLLPATGWVFGRKSAPHSHRIYRTDWPLDTAAEKYSDLDGAMLIELRGTGGLTVYPPSLHRETGEAIRWETFADPADVALDDLQRAVREVAAAAILARHWPSKGSRDETAMALAGGLTRSGWEQEKVEQFVEAVAVAASDEEPRMRAAKAAPAGRKIEAGEKVTGWPTVAKRLGQFGPEVVDKVRDWLGITTTSSVDELPMPEPTPWPDPPARKRFTVWPVASSAPSSRRARPTRRPCWCKR